MIGRGRRVLLRHYLEQGMTKAAIARQVGVSRDTIYRWIRTGQLDRGSGRGSREVWAEAAGAFEAGPLQGDH